MGRTGSQVGYYPPATRGDYLQLANTGAWSIVRSNSSGQLTTLASGSVSAPGLSTWQHLALTLNGATISVAINGVTLGTVTDSTYSSGMPGFGTSGYQTDQFDNLSVASISGGGGGGGSGATGPIVSGDNSSKCVDANGGSSTPGTKVQMWDCDANASSQSWTVASNGTLQIDGQCLDITGANYSNGTLVETWTCNGGANQQWEASNGELVNPASGKCLDDPASNTANGTQLDIWSCNGGTNQQWHLP